MISVRWGRRVTKAALQRCVQAPSFVLYMVILHACTKVQSLWCDSVSTFRQKEQDPAGALNTYLVCPI